MGIGDFITGIFGSKNQGPGPAPEYGDRAGAADEDVGRYRGMGAAAAGRGGVAIGDRGQAQDRQLSMQARAQNQQAINLARQAALGQAPSVASIQQQQGLGQAMRAQLSMAGGARGGAMAQAAARDAATNAGSQMQNAAVNQAASLRAQEMATARDQFGQMTAQQRATDLQSRGMSQQEAIAQAQFEDAQRGRNDAMQMGYEQMGQGIRYAQLGAKSGNQGLIAQANAQNAGMNQANALGAIGLGANVAGGIMKSDVNAKADIEGMAGGVPELAALGMRTPGGPGAMGGAQGTGAVGWGGYSKDTAVDGTRFLDSRSQGGGSPTSYADQQDVASGMNLKGAIMPISSPGEKKTDIDPLVKRSLKKGVKSPAMPAGPSLGTMFASQQIDTRPALTPEEERDRAVNRALDQADEQRQAAREATEKSVKAMTPIEQMGAGGMAISVPAPVGAAGRGVSPVDVGKAAGAKAEKEPGFAEGLVGAFGNGISAWQNAGAPVYQVRSDERSKGGAGPGAGTIDALLDAFADSGATYRYKSDSDQPVGNPKPGARYAGVMAQRVEQVPEIGKSIVTDTPNGKVLEGPALLSALAAAVGRLEQKVGGKGARRG